jgi:hypothetical protein
VSLTIMATPRTGSLPRPTHTEHPDLLIPDLPDVVAMIVKDTVGARLGRRADNVAVIS